jgi:hypothetical protein
MAKKKTEVKSGGRPPPSKQSLDDFLANWSDDDDDDDEQEVGPKLANGKLVNGSKNGVNGHQVIGSSFLSPTSPGAKSYDHELQLKRCVARFRTFFFNVYCKNVLAYYNAVNSEVVGLAPEIIIKIAFLSKGVYQCVVCIEIVCNYSTISVDGSRNDRAFLVWTYFCMTGSLIF